jgi:hypothetical protein
MSFSPQWHALGREAELAGAQIALGVTALGRASHARLGDYTIAFFSLTIGLERMGKLIVIADHAIEHHGEFPDNHFLKKKISHDLALLLDHCEAVAAVRRSSGDYSKRPNEKVHQGIIQTLSEFGTLTRYYNLDLLAGGKAAKLPEPVGAWWKRVGEPILSKHYKAYHQERNNNMAEAMEELTRGRVMVRHHSETGEPINDYSTLVRRGGATRVVQKYGRLYVLQIVRWLTYLLFDLEHEGGKHRIEPLFGINEPFKLFLNEDRYFRERKTWAIYL